MKKETKFWGRLKEPGVLAAGSIIAGAIAFVLCTLALNAGSEDKTSDWISAFATTFGAAVTGGALLIAALTYQRQVADKHEFLKQEHQAQASGVSILLTKPVNQPSQRDILVRNDSNLPIFNIRIIATGKSQLQNTVAPTILAAGGRYSMEGAQQLCRECHSQVHRLGRD